MYFMFFSAQYLPTVGGVERYTASLGKELVNNGHRVTVVTSALPGLPAEETGEDGIHIVRLPVLPLMGGRFPVLKVSAEKKAFIKAFKAEKPDFCVIQTRFYTSSLMAARICKKYNVPSIVIDHSTSHLMSGGLVGTVADLYEHIAAKYIKNRTDGFYGVSRRCCEWLCHFGIEPDGVVYNCVSLKTIESIPVASKEDYGCDANVPLVVFAARLIEEKGVLKLIEAFKAVQEKAHLVIAGGGPLLERVLAEKDQNITVVGSLPFDKVIGLYKCADIFCLPTDYPEGFPTTILEAAACKAMVIATDKGGTTEIIRDNNFGIILKENTVENLVCALRAAICDEALRSVCAENSYELLKESFVWDKVAVDLEMMAVNIIKGKEQ